MHRAAQSCQNAAVGCARPAGKLGPRGAELSNAGLQVPSSLRDLTTPHLQRSSGIKIASNLLRVVRRRRTCVLSCAQTLLSSCVRSAGCTCPAELHRLISCSIAAASQISDSLRGNHWVLRAPGATKFSSAAAVRIASARPRGLTAVCRIASWAWSAGLSAPHSFTLYAP